MKKPQDPRNHGLKEPEKIVLKLVEFPVVATAFGKFDLKLVVAACNKAIKDHESIGHSITDGPYLIAYGYQPPMIQYSVEWENTNYQSELIAYNTAVSEYIKQLSEFNEAEDKRKLIPADLDGKIERAKQRLANLEATRDGSPLPYPS